MSTNPQIPRASRPFFDALKSFNDFNVIFDPGTYTPVPDGWLVVITDITNSTAAIKAGRYKDVNMIGAASISAVLNVTRANEVPYAFGGDGATFVVPAETLPRIREALLQTRNLSKSQFGLELRLGAVPVSHLRHMGTDVFVAKYELSPGNYLAMFSGGGVSAAERMIKADDGSKGYLIIDEIPDSSPDLDGLSCRWEPLKSRRGTMLSMLVHALSDDHLEQTAIYNQVLGRLQSELGPGFEENRPVSADNMRFRWPPKGITAEAKTTRGRGGYLGRLLFLCWQSFVQMLLERFDLSAGGYNAPVYRQELRANSDYKRFDDTLRLILDCSEEEVEIINAVLSDFRARKQIAFGLHQADSALMTCLLFSLTESKHVHFIDGSDGGFAVAAQQLKQQLIDG